MFWKKKFHKQAMEMPVAVETMPVEFYGGINPIVKFKNVEKEVDWPDGTHKIITTSTKSSSVSTAATTFVANRSFASLLTKPKFLLLIVGGLFVIFTAIAGIYYWRMQGVARRSIMVTPSDNSVNQSVSIPSTSLASEIISMTTTSDRLNTDIMSATNTLTNIVPATTDDDLFSIPPVYPSLLLGRNTDTDNDGLTDVAEELFLTDLGAPDSDGDKYGDSHEIYNLYNPIGKEPLKLSDSGLVANFTNPVFGYKIYYPKDWVVGNVDDEYREVVFSTLNGESVEVRVFDKIPDETFADWFVRWSPMEKMENLIDFQSVFQLLGKQRKDGLVYYFTTPRRVYVLIYHTLDSSVAINYEIVIKMMARSFRLALTDEILPMPIIEDSGLIATSSFVTETIGELLP